MDAAYNFKKIALFLAIALLSFGAWNTSAYAQSITTCGSVSLSSQNFQASCTVASTGANIPYTASISYGDSVTGWLDNPGSGTATSAGSAISITLGSTAILSQNPGSHTATITLTPNPAGPTAGTISVTYNPGQGGTGSGVVSASATSMVFCVSSCSNPQTLQLTTTSTNPVSFTVSPPAWLSVSPSSGTVSSSSPVTLTVTVTNFALASSQATMTIGYTGGSTTVSINVTSGGGGGTGSGTITATPSTVTWTYATNGQAPASQNVSFTDFSGASFWRAAVTNSNSGDPAWVAVSYNGASVSDTGYIGLGGGTSGAFAIVPTANISSLSNTTHTATITISDNLSNSAVVTVSVSVNGSSANNGLSVTPAAITLPSVGAGSTAQVSNSATVTSTNGGTLSAGYSGTCPGISAAFGSSTIIGNGGGVTLTVYGNPTSLGQGTYTGCTVTVTLLNGSSQSIATVNVPVSWVIGSGSTGTGGASSPVLPTSLNFVSQNGNTASLTSQVVTITATGGWSSSVSSTPSGWLTADAAGTGPGTANISVNPTGLSAGSYSGSVTFTTPSGAQTVSVNLLITSTTPVIFANQASLSLQASSGTIIGSESFQVLASDGSNIPYTVSTSTSWLSLFSPATDRTPSFVSFTVNLSGLANGVYQGAINIAASTAGNSSLTVPIVLTVSGSTASTGSLTFGSSSLTFSAQAGGSAPATQNLLVTAPPGVTYTASASGSTTGVNWLTISPSGGITSASQTFIVSVNQGTLPSGNYTGYINFVSSSGASQSVTVNLSVSGTGTTNTVTASPASLTFNASQNGSAPAAQSFTVSSAAGAAAVSFNMSTTVSSGSNSWLSASTSGYTTPASVAVTVNPTGLAAATYNGTVVITPFGGGATLNVPVTLVVSGLPTVSASPSSLNLSYSVGSTAPTSTINVSGTAGTAGLNYTASVTSTCNCISISPSSGNTAGNPTITVSLTNPTSLAAGSYTGTITVAGTNGSTGSTTVSVTLTVTAPLPTLSSVVNAASGVSGAVSPGEIVSLFGSAMGPSTAVALSASNLTSSGNVPTTMGGVQVLFNGLPAALLYVSDTQINAVVPYGVSRFNTFPVIVSYAGQTSNGVSVRAATTVPGIFTQNNSGTGPGAILNSDGSTNGPSHPAAKGSVISVYMTGEGATTPQGVDGQVTCGLTGTGCSSLSQIPVPLLPVAILVNGQPAALATAPGWLGYGEAPGLVSGVMQVTIVIPANAASGNIPLSISVGGNPSQQNVTVSVQ